VKQVVEKEKRDSSRESTSLRKVWMFDVDGVLVSLLSKRADEALIDILAQQLREGDIVTFNSGRSPVAISQLVLSLLERRIANRKLLERMMIVGEKGGAWAHYSSEGTLQIAFDPDLTVPFLLTSAMTELVEDQEFREVLEIESGKQTMLSVIKRKGVELQVFEHVQKRFVPLAEQCLADLGFHTAWKVDAVSDAIEIEPMSASKAKGASKILRWLCSQGIQPQRIIAIEDSPSGIAMAEAIHRERVLVEFVFTGSRPLPHRTYGFPIIYTTRKYEKGTFEYLACHQQSLLAESLVRG
jgi:hydroxymethylpyrimidine pyrophosphatase-like HAD family hydrolase